MRRRRWPRRQAGAVAVHREGVRQKAGQKGKAGAAMPQTRPLQHRPHEPDPQRMVAHRPTEWRKWLAKALMTQPQRSQRVLIALVLAGRADLREAQFRKCLDRMAARRHPPVWCAVGSSADAARGPAGSPAASRHGIRCLRVNTSDLELLLNYAEVDEGRYFQWDKEFLDLFTMGTGEPCGRSRSEEGHGHRLQAARASKKQEFIAALLKVQASLPGHGARRDALPAPASPGRGRAGRRRCQVDEVEAPKLPPAIQTFSRRRPRPDGHPRPGQQGTGPSMVWTAPPGAMSHIPQGA